MNHKYYYFSLAFEGYYVYLECFTWNN